MAKTRGILFDLFGVLMHKQPVEFQADMAAIAGVEQERFTQAYWNQRPPYDCGCPQEAYWETVSKEIGVRLDDRQVERLTAVDNRSWSAENEKSIGVLRDLAHHGTPLFLLSNIPSPLKYHLESLCPWLTECFIENVYSCDLEVAKPEPTAFRSALSLIQQRESAIQLLFVDDSPTNVAAARELSIESWQYEDHEQLQSQVAQWLSG